MLFVNFLCLLYLMLLVNGLTVSNNIDSSYFDERVDSLHDLEYTTRHKSKHDKFLHKHRRVKSGITAPASKVTIRVSTNEAKSTEATLKPQHIKLHKSTKRRIGGFWRKFKNKENKNLEREKRLKNQYQQLKTNYERPLYSNEYKIQDKMLLKRKNMNTLSFEKKKREITKVTKRLNKLKEAKNQMSDEVNITPYENFSSTVKASTRMKALSNDEELRKMITTMATKVTELKQQYGLENYRPSYTSTHNILYTTEHTTTSTPTTTENLDIPGTAQLEALLNDIKEKALHLIVEQNPAITDLITNTVTEATFEADPLLTHLEINSPAYSLYTFITLNSDFGKRNANITKADEKSIVNLDTSTNYNREGRSVAEDAMTAAQSIEDILQKEVKNIYKKVKNKVSGDFRKEVNKVKTTLKPQTKKISCKVSPAKQSAATKTTTQSSKKCKSTTQLLQNRVDRKSGKHTKVTEQEITTTPTADDFALLTLYEQMLSKSCQNNIMNMVTSRDGVIRKKRNKQLVSNRNFETLFDQNIKEDVGKLYEDREEIPDELEYNFDVNLPEVSTVETATGSDYSHTKDKESETKNEIGDLGTEITPYDNSYEGLSSQISYNEYVNGYKHYLNFQKEQANEKFSNLVRYQAHRHHNVDDIGKYILDKIPPLPSRDKRFFEYEDDHDSSTKSEESWFKKHFYMFIDSGTPKKYHSSQTISLKSPTPEAYDLSVHKMENFERSDSEDQVQVSSEAEDNAVDFNLEKLSQALEEHKVTSSGISVQDNALKDSNSKNAGKRQGHIFKSFTAPHIIDKVFGKEHKTYETADIESNNIDLNDYYLNDDYLKYGRNKDVIFLISDELNRKRRSSENPKEKATSFSENLRFQTKKSIKLINFTKTNKKQDKAKLGCVDIDLVVPPTAIVKLKDNKRKEGKLKRIFQKLHLSRPNKKKVKRDYRSAEYTRKQRSNPFQKLKNIFKSTQKGKDLKSGSPISDYDIMSSHIDTFKPMKFDKALNIEEIKKQIPNITGELSATEASKLADNEISWNPRTTEKGFTDFKVLLNTTLKSLPVIPSTKSSQLVEGPNRDLTRKTTKKVKMQNIEELLKVNVETKPTNEPYKKIISIPPQHMPLNDIKDQLENIIIKINSDDNNRIHSTKGPPHLNFLINNKLPVCKVPLKSNFNSFYTKIPKNKNSHANSKIRPNSEKHTILDLEQISEFVEDNNYLKTLKPEFNNNHLMTTQPSITMFLPTRNLLSLSRSISHEEKGKYKPYPDYFSDLLMWNKDLLNSDGVPTPWRDILKNMNHELEYSTPDMSVLQQELIKINDGLNPNIHTFKGSPTSTYSHEGITPRNWFQRMVVEKPPIEKSILIEQEKKFVKLDPKTDRHLKAADFVNELNKFAKILSGDSYNLQKIYVPGHVFDIKENKDQSVILVDTTLLAYDDDVNYISTLTPRELSKNVLKFANLSNNGAASLKAKSNKQPQQYFATPLPMKMTDFEEFLKSNQLDVESVTSPIVDLPTVNAYAPKEYSKAKPLKKITSTSAKKKQKATKAKSTTLKPHDLRGTRKITFSDTSGNVKHSENQFDYLDDLEWDLFKDYYNSVGKERFKRYNDLHYDSYFVNLNTDKKQWNKANKSINKNPLTNLDSDFKIHKIPETTDDLTPKDFEITIINFGDINKLKDEYVPIKSETTDQQFTEVTETTLGAVDMTPLNVDLIEKGSKDSEFLHKLHNDLFYDHTHTNSKETSEATDVIKIEEATIPTPPLGFHEAVLKKMPIKINHEPKRVRISSQSYKYDIIYHHPEKIKIDRGTHFPSYVTTTTTQVTPTDEMLSSYDSDFSGAKESDVARGDCGKTRIVRKVKTSTEMSVKEIKDTATLKTNSKNHSRRHKLKRLFPAIQDKLRMFSKNSSTFSDFLQKPSTIILSSTSGTESGKEVSTKTAKITAETTCVEKAVTKFFANYNGDGTRKLERMTSNTINGKLTTSTSAIVLMKKRNMEDNTNGYNELGNYEKQAYVDSKVADRPITTKSRTSNITNSNDNKDYINKREIQNVETHTAKDVAALEVIVDMMKNPLKHDENNRFSSINKNDNPLTKDKMNAYPNSIQVHIAVPYEIENSKKRSLETVKVRKVFAAKLSTPVDIEYQVHSFEEPPTTQKAFDDMEGLSPGVYLLVDNTYFPQGVALKPMKVRQVKSTTEKMTSTYSTKNLAKVTLSKDFISAINKQLILLYNLTTLDKRDNTSNTKRNNKFKRSINWDAINKIFGHDRVCHCKCKVNKTLCRACAASDAVMSELIFEFENLSKYMADHCTEIQTYFWMNPAGGKRLKDSVHKIDQSLRDYYKRVRGKCQGRTCKTFTTYIDKREFHKNVKRSKNAGYNFINDLEAIAKDIDKATKTVTCFKENLDDEVNKLKHIINNCILKSHNKRSNVHYTQDTDVKNIYSLDKINVNIICNTESTLPYIASVTPQNHEKNIWFDTEYKEQNPKGFMKLFSRFRKQKKNKAFAEYLKETNKSFHKREIKENQIESPLISDTGGSFWHDYIRKSSSEPKFARSSRSNIGIHTTHDDTAITKNKNECLELTTHKLKDNILSTTQAYPTNILNSNSDQSPLSSEGGDLMNNINQFLKLFGNLDMRTTQYKDNPPPHKKTTTHKKKTKKIKHKKTKNKLHKTIKTKMHKIPNSTNVTKLIPSNSSELQYKTKIEATLPNIRITKTLGINNITALFKTTKLTTTESTTITKANILKKIKMLTTDFFKNFGAVNSSQDPAPKKREHNFSAMSSEYIAKYKGSTMKNYQSDEHVTSDTTTESNPNIIIIDDTDEPRRSGYKDLLLSVIDYESNKLNKEWMKFANINLNKVETKQTNQHKTTKKLKTTMSTTTDNSNNYDILHDLEPLFAAKSNETESTISLPALLNKIGKKFKIKVGDKNEITTKKMSVASEKPSTKKMTTHSNTSSEAREADDSTAEPRICNLQATRQHILNIRNEMPTKDFEEYVANLTCQKYEPVPKTIFFGKTRNEHQGNLRKWNWIRDRRSAFRSKSKPKYNTRRILHLLGSEFEVYYRGEHNIYKQKMRMKRCANTENFINELKDLPRLDDNEKAIHALAGDTVNISCRDDRKQYFKDLTEDKCVWKTDRDNMLDYTNVVVGGDVVKIVEVQPRNYGYYICKKRDLIKRKVKLAVLSLPNLILLSTLLYTKETECTHDDLKRLKLLGPEISKKLFQEQGTVRIENPVCLKDKIDGKIKVQTLSTVNCQRPAVDCSVSCRRDLQAAFASMCAENVPALASINVVLLKGGVNSTWRPSKYHRKSIVTRSLEDFTNHDDYTYSTDLSPGSLHLVVSCPAGYRLLSYLKVCAPCPVNTYAREGDNTCLSCPRGSRSTPGADRCHRAVGRSRRYDWWICPPCGYGMAFVVALCCCGVCVALALLVQVTSRNCGATDAQNMKDSSELPGKMDRRNNPGRTRSSRVILAKFFKPSLTSSMATDSQETKFDIWKARNLPPPLPPVDFDT